MKDDPKKRYVVKQADETDPVPVEVIATAIRDIAVGVRTMQASRSAPSLCFSMT